MKQLIKTLTMACLCAMMAVGVAVAQTTSSTTVKHIVDRGETLASIAKHYGTTEAKIKELNPDAAQFIYVGMELLIPAAPAPTTPAAQPAKSTPQKDVKDKPRQQTNNTHTPYAIGKKNNSGVDGFNSYQFNQSNRGGLTTYLALQGGVGKSNFEWDDGSVNGDLSYAVDIMAQMYFASRKLFIPRNWYMEYGVGYNKMGAADFGMSYVRLDVLPLGYALPLGSFNLVLKGGGVVSYPINDLKTENGNSWGGDLQLGFTVGLQIDWNKFSIGCTYQKDFTQVSGSAPERLYNYAVLGTISYKFAKF